MNNWFGKHFHHALIVVFVGIINQGILAAAPSEFLLDIDGSSLTTSADHACVIAYKHGVDVGGKVICWTGNAPEQDYFQLDPPQDKIFVQISGGFSFDCGVTIDQELHCWGHNVITSQQQIPGLYTQVTVDDFYACAILTDGRISCFGASELINKIPKFPNIRFVQISCAASHCCAIDDNANPHCFGNALAVAINPPTSDTVPKDEDEEEDEEEEGNNEDPALQDEQSPQFQHLKFRQISVGEHYSCGITVGNDDLRCWGHENFKHFPRHLPGPYKQVSVGRGSLCAIRGVVSDAQMEANESSLPSHHVKCWGYAKNFGEGIEWDQITVGTRRIICGVTMDSEVLCSGTRAIGKIPTNTVAA